jgi:hypothetical protein
MDSIDTNVDFCLTLEPAIATDVLKGIAGLGPAIARGRVPRIDSLLNPAHPSNSSQNQEISMGRPLIALPLVLISFVGIPVSLVRAETPYPIGPGHRQLADC